MTLEDLFNFLHADDEQDFENKTSSDLSDLLKENERLKREIEMIKTQRDNTIALLNENMKDLMAVVEWAAAIRRKNRRIKGQSFN